MNPIVALDERVEVVALFEKTKTGRCPCTPYKMRRAGQAQDVVFTIFGMHHPTVQGKRMIHVFEMSDGSNDYRLEFDAEALVWRLTAILEGGHA